jgi:anti-sigma B factor antagonist
LNSGPPFSAQVSQEDGNAVLRVTGDLDLASASRLRTTAAELISAHLHRLTIDLTDLTFADLSGLRALVAVGDDLVIGGAEFRLVGVNDYLLRIIRVADFEDLVRASGTTPA